jgi:hypothetical protein
MFHISSLKTEEMQLKSIFAKLLSWREARNKFNDNVHNASLKSLCLSFGGFGNAYKDLWTQKRLGSGCGT